MIIRNGRYPIDVSESRGLVSGGAPSEFIPNDTYASDDKFFTVITGINGTGS
jgi:DNA mismatch repair ATPase MutS